MRWQVPKKGGYIVTGVRWGRGLCAIENTNGWSKLHAPKENKTISSDASNTKMNLYLECSLLLFKTAVVIGRHGRRLG
jgi:hypothetical protein